jgi:hypothetical protein
MKREAREIEKIARSSGLEKPKFRQGCPHGRLTGYCNGKEIKLVVSMTKATSCQRNIKNLKLHIKRAIEEAQRGDHP